jgi:hypothetical protein
MIFIDGGAVCGTAIFVFVDRGGRDRGATGGRCEPSRLEASRRRRNETEPANLIERRASGSGPLKRP